MVDGKFVAALILNPRNEILLQRKDLGYKKWPGFWTVFGGEMEKDESPRQALEREVVTEETGIVLSNIKLFGTLFIDESRYGKYGKPNPSRGPDYFFSARFDGDLSKISLKEGAGFSVFHEKELPSIKGRTFYYVYEAIQKFYGALRAGTFKV